jgi:hypothetical protein
MKKSWLIVFLVFASWLHATPNRITDLTVVSTMSTKIVLSCTVPKMQVGVTNKSAPVEPVTEIELRMDSSSSRLNSTKYDQCEVAYVVRDLGPVGTKLMITVEGLDPNTKYYFACKAKDSKWNQVSNIVNGTTRGDDKTIRVEWTYKEDGGVTPEAVVILHGGTKELLDKPMVVKGDTYSADITGLKWGVAHYWCVITVNAEGDTKESPLRSDSK